MVKLWRDRSYERFEECFLALGGRKKKEKKMVMPSSGSASPPCPLPALLPSLPGKCYLEGGCTGAGRGGGGGCMARDLETQGRGTSHPAGGGELPGVSGRPGGLR